MEQELNPKAKKKALKKAAKKAKRRHTGWPKALSILSGVLAFVLAAALVVVSMFDNTMAAFVGGSFWELQNPDDRAIYYAGDFDTVEQMAEYGLQVCYNTEAEGAALLKNENGALPIAAGSKVSLFSTSSINLVYGGTGSGNVDASNAKNLNQVLTAAGLQVNNTLWDFYGSDACKKYRRAGGGMVSLSSATTAEAPWSVYTEAVLNSVKDFGDAAIVTFSRVGGEGADLTYQDGNYLALDDNETELMEHLAQMKQQGTVKKIVVLINSANALQVDFLKDDRYSVDAVLWVGDVGISGIDAVADILAGKVNPSGCLVDTYSFNNYSSPAMYNFTPVTYQGYVKGEIPANASTYMIYQEGIYVGYKYYETRYEDYVMGTGNAGEFRYADQVAYPFGYGQSYTTFAFSDLKVLYAAASDRYSIGVRVTNTGSTAGKKTVQIYAQSPYTQYDRDNRVEKASVSLVGFAKTGLLQPGESEVVTVTVEARDLASFDAYGQGHYILDAGDYYLTAAGDAHEAVNNILAAKGYTPASTAGRMDAAGNVGMTYGWQEESLKVYTTSKNGTEVTVQLGNADPNLNPDVQEKVTFLSRQDWTGTFPSETVKLTLTDALKAALQDVQYDPSLCEETEMPTLGAAGNAKLVDMIGKSYDDPAWETLLDQMTFDEMVALIGDSFHWTMPVVSVQAPGTRDENGPQGLTASLLGSDATQLDATAFTSEDVMAATFNTDIMTEIGRVIGNNCLQAEIAVLYGPGNNIHRTPYGGRNFEYYSEDGFLSGIMSAYECTAIEAKGVHVVMKHFALNDCEQDRIGLGVWLTEQAARELYLKAFQAPIEAGNGGVMTAYTRWGTRWSGGYSALMTSILREEWGCQDLCITDNVLTSYCNGVDGILAGTSTFDAMLPYVTDQLPDYRNDAVVVNAMRTACHRNLYTIANSVGMNRVGPNTTVKATPLSIIGTVRTLLIVVVFLLAVGIVFWVRGAAVYHGTKEYQEWKAFRSAKKRK